MLTISESFFFFFSPYFSCSSWSYYSHDSLLNYKQIMYRWFIICSHWNPRPVRRQCQMRTIYSRQNHESSQLEGWFICRVSHPSFPYLYCSGHILDDGVYSKASAFSSGWRLNLNFDALFSLEADGCETTSMKLPLWEVR